MQIRKKHLFPALILLGILAITLAYGDTVTKGLIGQQDINLTQTDNAALETFSRGTSTGSTMLLYKLTGNAIPWDNAYTRIIRPKSVLGNSTGVISGYDNVTATSGLYSALLSLTGNASVGGNLNVAGTGVVIGALSSASLSTGTGTFSSDINANGNIVGDGATTASGIARYYLDGKAIDTGTAAPTSGTWAAGDIVINSAPTAMSTIAKTGALYWRCITGGTPGAWEAVYPVFTVAPDNAAMIDTEKGMVAMANGYWHACIADNTWQRVVTTTW